MRALILALSVIFFTSCQKEILTDISKKVSKEKAPEKVKEEPLPEEPQPEEPKPVIMWQFFSVTRPIIQVQVSSTLFCK